MLDKNQYPTSLGDFDEAAIYDIKSKVIHLINRDFQEKGIENISLEESAAALTSLFEYIGRLNQWVAAVKSTPGKEGFKTTYKSKSYAERKQLLLDGVRDSLTGHFKSAGKPLYSLLDNSANMIAGSFLGYLTAQSPNLFKTWKTYVLLAEEELS